MRIEDLKKYSRFNEEELPFSDRLKLAKMTKNGPDKMALILFNTHPTALREYERVYFAKFFSKDYSFYVRNDVVYAGPSNLKEQGEQAFDEYFIPTDANENRVDDLYKNHIGIGFRNLRIYSVLPGIKYKLMKGKTLTGFPSKDRPWSTQKEKFKIKQKNLISFFDAGRNKLLASKQAFQCYDQKVTWDELKSMVETYIKALTANGIGKNDVVPVCTQSIIESVAIFFAADAIGAITHFIDPDNTSVNIIHKYFQRYSEKIVFTTPQYVDSIQSCIGDTNIKKVVVISPADELRKCDELSEASKEYIKKCDVPYEKTNKTITLDEFVKMGEEYTGPIELCKDNKKVTLMTSTSGTSGEPKVVDLTRENIMYEMMYIKSTTHVDIGPKGVNMQVVPFKYPYGFVISTLLSLYGGKTSGLCPDLTPSNYLNFINLYKPTYIHAIPSFYKNMLDDPNVGDLSFLQFAVSGGDFYDFKSIEQANEFFRRHGSKAKIKNGFGSAEATACVSAATFGKYNIESLGKPLVGTNVKIIDENDEELPYGHMGRICYSGGNVMQGYDGDEENTSYVRKVDKDGKPWIVSDAIGFVDNEGFLYICDRERNLFITYSDTGAPFKVYPTYVQTIINSIEGVDDSIVVKAPDEKRILVPHAYIVVKDGYDEEKVLAKVKEKCDQELDKCAIPVEIEIIPEIKTKESGKANIRFYENQLIDEHEAKKKGVKNL